MFRRSRRLAIAVAALAFMGAACRRREPAPSPPAVPGPLNGTWSGNLNFHNRNWRPEVLTLHLAHRSPMQVAGDFRVGQATGTAAGILTSSHVMIALVTAGDGSCPTSFSGNGELSDGNLALNLSWANCSITVPRIDGVLKRQP